MRPRERLCGRPAPARRWGGVPGAGRAGRRPGFRVEAQGVRDIRLDGAVAGAQGPQEQAHRRRGGAAEGRPGRGAAVVAGSPVLQQGPGRQFGQAEVLDDRLVRDAEEGEDQGGELTGAVLAGGAVEHQAAVRVGHQAQRRRDLLRAVLGHFQVAGAEVGAGLDVRRRGGLVVGAVLDAEVVVGEGVVRRDPARGLRLPGVAQVHDRADAQGEEAVPVGCARSESAEGSRAEQEARADPVAGSGRISAQVAEVVQGLERYVSVHGQDLRGEGAGTGGPLRCRQLGGRVASAEVLRRAGEGRRPVAGGRGTTLPPR